MLNPTIAPKDIAQSWGCKVDKVLALIAAKKLVAFNIGLGKGKPRWRIRPEDLEDFEQSRSTRPAPKPIERSRRKSLSPAKNYFA